MTNIEIYAAEDDPTVDPENLKWVPVAYQRVCAQGHLVTDTFNSYVVSRGGAATSYACKLCQLDANARLKEKKEPGEAAPTEEEIFAEHAPAPDEKPGELVRGGVKVPLDSEVLTVLSRIESKLDQIVNGEPPISTWARLQQHRIEDLEKELAELKKGPALEDMTFDQLKAKAIELGIEIPKGLRSAGARKLIEEHLAGQAPDTAPEDVEGAAHAAAGDPEETVQAEEPVNEDDPAVELQHEGIVEAESGEEEEPPRRRRRAKPSDEELEAKAQEAIERQKAKTAARKILAEEPSVEAEEEEPPRRRRRRQAPEADES